MPVIDKKSLAKRINDGTIDNLYFFYGKDVFSIENYAKRLVSKLIPKDSEDLNLHKFSGRNLDLTAFSDTVESYPMFLDHSLVVISDLDLKELKKDDYSYLKKILSDLPKETIVLVYITSLSIYKSKTKLDDKYTAFVKFVEKNGVAVEFPLETQTEIQNKIIKLCAKQNAEISKADANYLAGKCLRNMVLIKNEVDKLCSYVNGGVIDKSVIDSLCETQIDTDAFKLSDAIARGDERQTFTILRTLYDLQSEPIALLGAISSNFIDIYRARIARDTKRTNKDVIDDFSYLPHVKFKVDNAFRICSKYKAEKLRKCLKIMQNADIEMKSSINDKKLILEQAIAEMLVS